MHTEKTLVLNDMGGNIMNVTYDVTTTLRANMKHHEPIVLINQGSAMGRTVYDPSRRHNYGCLGETCCTLESRLGTGGGNVPIVIEPSSSKEMINGEVLPTNPICFRPEQTIKIDMDGVSFTLESREYKAPQCVAEINKIQNTNNQVMTSKQKTNDVVILTPWDSQGNQITDSNGVCHTVRGCGGAGYQQGYVFVHEHQIEQLSVDKERYNCGVKMDGEPKANYDAVTPTVCEDEQMSGVCIGNGQPDQLGMSPLVGALNCMHDQQAVMIKNNKGEQELENSVVRRLTPDECASLQGFPRNWCNIGDWTDTKGRVHRDADSPKYKAYGNSIAVGYDNEQSGFWCWLARRICAQYERRITLGSLFDGIGGFPLAFEACGAKAVWASEIEEFPIAVTKYHFPEEDDG